jgi:hypothetical protein
MAEELVDGDAKSVGDGGEEVAVGCVVGAS